LIVSARAFSKLSPTVPTDAAMPASARRSVYRMETPALVGVHQHLGQGVLAAADRDRHL
jgi:hypothetical protein